MDQRDKFTVVDLAAKCRSKTELYSILIREGNIYLPPKQDSTQKFLREIMMAKRKYIKCENITAIKVKQYKGLTVKSILEFANKNIHIDRFLPDYDYLKDPNREWLCNIINTIIPDKFQNYVQTKVEERRQQLIDTQNLGISVQPEFNPSS